MPGTEQNPHDSGTEDSFVLKVAWTRSGTLWRKLSRMKPSMSVPLSGSG